MNDLEEAIRDDERKESDRLMSRIRTPQYIDPADCSCSGDEPCHRCGAHIGCNCHS